jgi:3-hydroxyisobutyrate dehydrogenase
MSQFKIGWAGLGNMGTPMVKNLLKAGYEVKVYNRTKEKEKEAVEAGASSANSLQQLTKDCEIIMVMVSDDDACKEIFTGGEGLLSVDSQGKIFINVSTVAAETSKELAQQCTAKGAQFIEAPVSGSVKPAQDATLIIMAGGDAETFEKVKPVFDAIGKLALHIGPVGTGSAAKLAINYLLGLNLQGLAETVLFANKGGVSTETMLTIINEGAVGNGITKLKGPAIQKNEYPAAFALKHLTKDLRLAREQGLKAPLSQSLYDTFKSANETGLGDEDVMAVMKYLASQAS